MKKHLALAFCSLRPSQLSEKICDAREQEYLICLKQLEKVIPESFDILICENTINNLDEIKNNELKQFLNTRDTCPIGKEGNIGTVNKGMGELLMLKSALDETDLNLYETVSYITARRFYTCPYVFEKAENLKKKALISNPDVLYFLSGSFHESCKVQQYNDMFFSMKTSTIIEYANYAMNYINDNHVILGTNPGDPIPWFGSEQLLYKFIHDNNIEYEWI